MYRPLGKTFLGLEVKFIKVQQDNAPGHIDGKTADFTSVAQRYDWNIQLVSQPSNSPDFNILDLGFFPAIQSLDYDENMRTVEDIVRCTKSTVKNVSSDALEDKFLSLRKHLEASMADMGGNKFKEPHMKKKKRRDQGEIIDELPCRTNVYNAARTLLTRARPGSKW